MSATRHCEECGAVLDPTKVLRCIKCKVCFYCSRECQTRNWRLHKRVCTTEPLLRRFVPVEMAVERSLAKQPSMEQAPKEAFCYICLEGDGKSSKLRRGCACRGDSAGFVHLECLAELAASQVDCDAVFKAWTKCGNCKQSFTGALGLEMDRCFWRRYRSRQDQLTLRYNSTRNLAIWLGDNAENDAANQLLDEVSTCVGHDKELLLELKLLRAGLLIKNGEKLDALGLLQAMLPEAKLYTASPELYGVTLLHIADLLLGLDRYQGAYEAAAEAVASAKANFGLEDSRTLTAMKMHAVAYARLGRVEEAKTSFDDLLAIEIRVFGRDHKYTQDTLRKMRTYGYAESSG